MARKPTYEELKQRIRELEEETDKRKQAEEALRESEEKHRILIETSQDAICITTPEGKLIEANQSHMDLFGYTKEERSGFRVTETYVNPDDRLRFRKEIEGKGAVKNFAVTLRKMDGTEMDCLISSTVRRSKEGGILGYQGIIRDVTERKRAEEALRESEEKYRTILESIEEAYFEVDLKGNFTFFNDSLSVILGYSRDELMRKNNSDYMPPRTSEEIFSLFNQIYKTGKPVRKHGYEVIKKDGTHGFHELAASLMQDESGKPIGFRGIAHDITERKRAEEALEEEHRRLQKALEDVRTLRGIVPICASCKKIRDDKGYWNQVEVYVRDHTEAEFSHGVCPECMKKLYPEFAEDESGAKPE